MQCPICKKDLEIKNKKIGENEAGEAIYNEFAICRDCKKQWNLDKQREKKKKKHWLKKQLKPVRLQKSHTKSARLPKEKKLLPDVSFSDVDELFPGFLPDLLHI